MADSTKEIIHGIIQGFRDSILGISKILKYDASIDNSEGELKKNEPQTTLARRRAEKQKLKGNLENKGNKKEPTVKQRLFQCSLWNGGVFLDIADAAYVRSRGRPTPINLSVLVADLLFSVLLQAFFLIQSTLATFLPIPGVGYLVGFIHMSLLYSLYAFEYKWFNMGWEVHKRLAYIESYWPYFLGFGIPLAFLTSMSASAVISGCIFSILFPLFILSANDAEESSQVCKLILRSLAHPVSFPDLAAVWLLVSTAAQSQICQETIALGCGSYQQIEADETVCGSDGSHYVNLSTTTRDPSQQLFCDNKDLITCPSTVGHVCGSNGVIYKNDCEFAKAKCTDGSLSIESVSFCHHTTTTAKPTTLDPNQQLFCDNKEFIGCPTTVKHVCGSDGVVYNNDCEFAKAKCTNGALSIQPSSFCHHTL
uniref:Etoposide-induced protein 2.4-like protein n=1 Tax=Magallana gigas TaxID=29159 RepID=K1QPA2_MAGGI